jgi:hypothetical protein
MNYTLKKWKPSHSELVQWLKDHGTIKGGASTVTYGYPAVGTVAPTTAQAAIQNVLTCTVQFGDTDTTATITHNWGLSTTQNTALFPLVSIALSSTPTTAIPITLGVLGTNTVTVLKASAGGSAGTVTVNLMKPHSLLAYTN